MFTRQMIVDEARSYLDVPWVHQGRGRFGIDCAGLLVMVLRGVGFTIEDMFGYRRSPDGHLFLKLIRDQTVIAKEPKPGSIGMFREARFPTHCGFFAEQDGVLTLIHSYMPSGKVVEEPFANEWPRLLIDVRDMPGVVD